jgi:hypothetical protein
LVDLVIRELDSMKKGKRKLGFGAAFVLFANAGKDENLS